jgi:hypothetical protein
MLLKQKLSNALLLLAAMCLSLTAMTAKAGETAKTDFSTSLELIGQPDAVAAGHTGAGTSVVMIENSGLNYQYAENGKLLFGDCHRPADAIDHQGWKPEGKDCRVAWVMCVLWWGGGESEDYSYRNCQFNKEGPTGGHATTGAKIIAQTAPDTKIIAISICDTSYFCGPLNAKGALRWIYNKRLKDARKKANLSVCLKEIGACKRENQKWTQYWTDNFNNQSPAERFNIVAANLSYLALVDFDEDDEDKVVPAHFSSTCRARNPDPQNPDPEQYIDDWLKLRNRKTEVPEWYDFNEEFGNLRANRVLPVVAAGNGLKPSVVTANSVALPACAEGAVTVSGIKENHLDGFFADDSVATSVSPTLTTLASPAGNFTRLYFLRRPMAASSWAAPFVSGSIAVLKAADVAPDDLPEQTVARLVRSGVPVTQSRDCKPDAAKPKYVSLQCPPADVYGTPYHYELPRLHLKNAVADALAEN